MGRFAVLVCVAAVSGATFAVASAPGAQRGHRCAAGKVKSHVVYSRRAGGAKHRVTGCALRPPVGMASLGVALGKLRLASLSFGPPATLRALRSPAGRRLLAADAATDAAVAARALPGATAVAVAARVLPVATAATVTHDVSTGPVSLRDLGGAPIAGTTVTHYDTTEWSGNEPEIGGASDATFETVGTRVKRSAKTTRRVTIKALMSRCPDASGVAHGTLDFTERETYTIGGIVFTETSMFESTIAAQFADNARISSVHLDGHWSYTTGGSSSHRSVSGTATATDFHQGQRQDNMNNNYVQIKTAVTTGTDDGIATSGGYLGLWVTMGPEGILAQLLDQLQVRVLGGACVQVVPAADTVHVIAGHSVAIVAHLADSGGATFAGPITAYNGAGRVTPATAQANTDATFTYAAPASANPGDTDVVVLRHISRRGRGNEPVVKVIVDPSPYFPKRFDGMWTRTFTGISGYPGLTETINGTAAYVRDASFPQSLDTQSSIPYYAVSGTGNWTVSGSDPNPSTGCTANYSGSGSMAIRSNTANGTAEMSLENVSNNSAAPQPEPQPYYYSIHATGDNTGYFTIKSSGSAQCSSGPDGGGQIETNFLEVGDDHPFSAITPPGQVQKSASFKQLAGQLTHDDLSTGLHVNDSWSFTGSGQGP